eukprot:TRINITY_DN22778_c0_g1_i1.p1 TRINITY_DN22778_c0_g1~~TRINITY_DN22778_c0_g1_i1.p1  ORF type:complete len:144 (-),score=19.38 TRINITY_DN22778_c0_g1_i1:59-430(-)
MCIRDRSWSAHNNPEKVMLQIFQSLKVLSHAFYQDTDFLTRIFECPLEFRSNGFYVFFFNMRDLGYWNIIHHLYAKIKLKNDQENPSSIGGQLLFFKSIRVDKHVKPEFKMLWTLFYLSLIHI